MTEQVFVARQRELDQLQAFLDSALAGHGQVCFVTGEAGAGKTALLTEFARRAQDAHPDLIVAVGQGDAQTGAGDPYLPFREVLGLLTGDVEAKLAQGAITRENANRLRGVLNLSGQALVEYGPDLVDLFVPGAGLVMRAGKHIAAKVGWVDKLKQRLERRAAQAAVGSEGLDQSHIFEQYINVLRALAAQEPLVLVLDDLHWADRASIALLFRLGRRLEGNRILVVGTYRPDDVALGRDGERHTLEPVLNELKRYFGDIWVNLEQTEEVEGRQDGASSSCTRLLAGSHRSRMHPKSSLTRYFPSLPQRSPSQRQMRHRIVSRPSDAPYAWPESPGLKDNIPLVRSMFAGLNTPEFPETPWAAGGAHSTAIDMAIFGQMFLNHGCYGDARILSPASVVEMTRNQIPGVGAHFGEEFFPEAGWGLGWGIQENKKALYEGTLNSPIAFSHGGAGGVMLWVDPVYEIVGVYFSVVLRMTADGLHSIWPIDLFMNAVTAAVVDE